MGNKTRKALDLLKQNPGKSVYWAAKQVEVSPSVVYVALKKQENQEVCPTCNQIIKYR